LHATVDVDVVAITMPDRGKEQRYRHRYADGGRERHVRVSLCREHFGVASRQIGADYVQLRPTGRLQVGERRLLRAEARLDDAADPCGEEVSAVPTELLRQATYVADHPERIVHEALEVERSQHVELLRIRVAERNNQGIDCTSTRAADARELCQQAALLQNLERG